MVHHLVVVGGLGGPVIPRRATACSFAASGGAAPVGEVRREECTNQGNMEMDQLTEKLTASGASEPQRPAAGGTNAGHPSSSSDDCRNGAIAREGGARRRARGALDPEFPPEPGAQMEVEESPARRRRTGVRSRSGSSASEYRDTEEVPSNSMVSPSTEAGGQHLGGGEMDLEELEGLDPTDNLQMVRALLGLAETLVSETAGRSGVKRSVQRLSRVMLALGRRWIDQVESRPVAAGGKRRKRGPPEVTTEDLPPPPSPPPRTPPAAPPSAGAATGRVTPDAPGTSGPAAAAAAAGATEEGGGKSKKEKEKKKKKKKRKKRKKKKGAAAAAAAAGSGAPGVGGTTADGAGPSGAGPSQLACPCVAAHQVVHAGRAKAGEAETWATVVGRTGAKAKAPPPKAAKPPPAPPRPAVLSDGTRSRSRSNAVTRG